MQSFIDSKAKAVVGMAGRAQDFNFQISDIKSIAVGKCVLSVSKVRFLAVPDFCVGLSL